MYLGFTYSQQKTSICAFMACLIKTKKCPRQLRLLTEAFFVFGRSALTASTSIKHHRAYTAGCVAAVGVPRLGRLYPEGVAAVGGGGEVCRGGRPAVRGGPGAAVLAVFENVGHPADVAAAPVDIDTPRCVAGGDGDRGRCATRERHRAIIG